MLPASDNNFGFLFHLAIEQTYRCMVFASSWHNIEEWRPLLEIVYKDCEQPQVSFSYTIEDSTVCFTSLSSNTNAWFWSFGDGQYSFDEHPVHTYSAMIDSWVCLWSSNECGVSSYCDSIFFCKEPYGSFNYTFEGMIVHFSDSCFNTNKVYWSFGDNYYSDLRNPVHHYPAPGIYIVTLNMINNCMERSVSDTIRILHENIIGIGNNLIVYPNPSHGQVVVDFQKPIQVKQINVYNNRGRIVRKISVNEAVNLINIDLSNCYSGVYYIRVYFEDGSNELARVVVIYY